MLCAFQTALLPRRQTDPSPVEKVVTFDFWKGYGPLV